MSDDTPRHAVAAVPRHAVVTGASSGIGAAIVARRLREGWRVTGISRNAPAPSPPGYTHRAVDLLDGGAIAAALDGLHADALVHAAGLMRAAPLGALDAAAGEMLWRLHVEAAERLANALVPRMPDGGRVLLIGSRAAVGVAGRS